MSDAALGALAVAREYQALANQRFQAAGAVFVRNRDLRELWDANHVTRVTASTPEEIDRLLERAEEEFAGFPHRRFDTDFTTPPAFEARLALEGYERHEALVMLLEGELAGEAHQYEVRPVRGDPDWRAYAALHDIDWREDLQRNPALRFTAEAAGEMLQSRRAKSPPVRHWLACVDGQPRAYISSWAGADGVGQVEDLFTHPDFRRRGLATALIHHGVAVARREGAGPVVIVADPSDTPKQMYAAMGFRPVALTRIHLKRPGS